MKGEITNVIYYFAEKLKHTGRIREKLKALFGPCYRLVCRMLWAGGGTVPLPCRAACHT